MLAICISCNKNKKAEVALSSYSYNFGIIAPDSICYGDITITNVGNALLEIGEIETGCGCTKSSVDKDELSPEESCTLHFSYDSEGKGIGEKEELIIINANTDSLFYILQIKATIKK